MGDIRTAREIAMEKVKELGEATEEERLKWKYVPQGEQLAAEYLKDNTNLVAELGHFDDKIRKYVAQGAADVFIRNINLPRSEVLKKSTRHAMDGLKVVKSDKGAVENVYSRLRYLFNHYAEQGEQQRKQAHEALKVELEARMQQEMQRQMGAVMPMKINIENQPQFQQEWRKVLARLEGQYTNMLDEYKRELVSIR